MAIFGSVYLLKKANVSSTNIETKTAAKNWSSKRPIYSNFPGFSPFSTKLGR